MNPNPTIAKDLKNGNLLCIICNIQVKSKLWIAHSNGRKHRDNVMHFKNRHSAAATTQKVSTKRQLDEPSTSHTILPVKKSKVEVKELMAEDVKSGTPWEKDSMSKMMESNVQQHAQKKNIIEGVPEGFFEDEKLNKRVVETIEREANMEEEYANFMRELDEAKHEEEQREENEEHVVAIEHDIELIDEQINQWKRVNQLEVRRDKLFSTVTGKNGIYHRKAEEEEISDDDTDVDLTGWRSKGI